MWRVTIIIVAALASCALEAQPQAVPAQDVESRALAVEQNRPSAEEIARELVSFYQELVARLDERGVAMEEMQAAVEAGDVERVRELFGFTPEEFDAANERLQVIGAMADDVLEDLADVGSDGAETEGLQCKGAFTCQLAAFAVAANFPNYAGLGFLVIATVGCALEWCEWDDGPRTKQP